MHMTVYRGTDIMHMYTRQGSRLPYIPDTSPQNTSKHQDESVRDISSLLPHHERVDKRACTCNCIGQTIDRSSNQQRLTFPTAATAAAHLDSVYQDSK